MRSGHVRVDHASLWTASLAGYGWPRNAVTFSSAAGVGTATIYYLYINANDVEPSGGLYDRYLGFPLRCLAL